MLQVLFDECIGLEGPPVEDMEEEEEEEEDEEMEEAAWAEKTV